MFVRTAGHLDLKAIRDLLVETWRATYAPIYGAAKVDAINDDWHSIAALEKRVDQPRSEFVVADDGEAIAGMAFGTVEGEGKTVSLRQLYVRPSMQGRGIGGLLMDEIENAFPEANVMRVEVEQANSRAVAFYVGQGFAKVGHTANCGKAGSGIPADIYERPIVWNA